MLSSEIMIGSFCQFSSVGFGHNRDYDYDQEEDDNNQELDDLEVDNDEANTDVFDEVNVDKVT